MDGFFALHNLGHDKLHCRQCPLPDLNAQKGTSSESHGQRRLSIVNTAVEELLQHLVAEDHITNPTLQEVTKYQGRTYTRMGTDLWEPIPANNTSGSKPSIKIPLIFLLAPTDTVPSLASLPSIKVSQITKAHYNNPQWLDGFQTWVYKQLDVKPNSAATTLSEDYLKKLIPKTLIMELFIDFIHKTPDEKAKMLQFIITHELGHSEYKELHEKREASAWNRFLMVTGGIGVTLTAWAFWTYTQEEDEHALPLMATLFAGVVTEALSLIPSYMVTLGATSRENERDCDKLAHKEFKEGGELLFQMLTDGGKRMRQPSYYYSLLFDSEGSNRLISITHPPEAERLKNAK